MNISSIVVLCLVLVLLSTTEGHRRYGRRRKTERMINGTCTFSFPCNVKERTMVVAIYTRSVNLKVSDPFTVMRSMYRRRGYTVLNTKSISAGTIEIPFTARSYGNRRRNNYYCKLICYDCDTATTTTVKIPATELTTGEPITDVTTTDRIPTTVDMIPTTVDMIPTTVDMIPTTVDMIPTTVDMIPTTVDMIPTTTETIVDTTTELTPTTPVP